ncbi:MAG: hypothetical protein KatS3mg002_1381 [Candidatus Woesearchaeota archaeon]|nr:MAG: hypothetical protein KatS3mg002_1381 [Candidatus Woesearchaeota archaeon]
MAYCNTCKSNDCSCNTYTLPGGAPGPQGPQGPPGPPGPAGATILFNRVIDISTSTTSWETLYTYTLTGGTLDEEGDVLIITAFYKTNDNTVGPVYDKKIRIRFNGVDPFNGLEPPFFVGQNKFILTIKINRVTNTTFTGEYRLIFDNGIGSIETYFTGLSITNLDNDLNITIEANSFVAGDITLDHLKIEKREKV